MHQFFQRPFYLLQQVTMSVKGWESGVGKSFKEAPNFFFIFSFLVFFSALFILFPQLNLFKVLIWSQILNGILIPVVLLFILNLCNNVEIMGHHINSKKFNFFSYLIVLVMFIVNLILIIFEFKKM
jgi:Mn2+/Fe2+ NRAMP family transporter